MIRYTGRATTSIPCLHQRPNVDHGFRLLRICASYLLVYTLWYVKKIRLPFKCQCGWWKTSQSHFKTSQSHCKTSQSHFKTSQSHCTTSQSHCKTSQSHYKHAKLYSTVKHSAIWNVVAPTLYIYGVVCDICKNAVLYEVAPTVHCPYTLLYVTFARTLC